MADQQRADAYLRGRAAFKAGKTEADNPLTGDLGNEWLRGFKVARKEARFEATIAARRQAAGKGAQSYKVGDRVLAARSGSGNPYIVTAVNADGSYSVRRLRGGAPFGSTRRIAEEGLVPAPPRIGQFQPTATRVRGVTFEKLVDRWDARLRAAFLQSIYQLRDQAQIETIVRLLNAGDLEGAVRAVGLDPVAFRPYDQQFTAAFEQGGQTTAAVLPTLRDATGIKVVVRFNMRNRQAEQWLLDYSSRRITEILDDQRRMIRAQLQQGLSLGENPRTVALRLIGRIGPQGTRQGGLIGLTEYQAKFTVNYLRELESDNPAQALTRALRDRRFDRRVIAAAEGTGEPLTATEIDTMVRTYANRALRARAVAISRTEAMAALHQGQEEAFGQAVATGLIEKDQIGSTWRTSQDDRVRDTHAAMEGQTVAYGEYFTTGAGVQLLYPGDPSGPPEEIINCRCWREPAVDFLKGIK